MSKLLIFPVFLLLAMNLFPCGPKQEWIPILMYTLQGSEEYVGDSGNNYRFKIALLGSFHPGTHGLQNQCNNDICCDIFDRIANYKISYCITQPCHCTTTMSVPSKCQDLPLAYFCYPLDGLSCNGPYFHPFDQFSGGVANPGMRGGCPTGNQTNCKETDLSVQEFQGIFYYERGKNDSYPFNLVVKVCAVEGIKQTGSCKDATVIIKEPLDPCPDPCCAPNCPVNCPLSPEDDCDDGGGGGGKCKGTLRVSSNGWITFRVLKQGQEVVPWTNLSNVNTNPALVANGPLAYQVNCGTYDLEYDEMDQKEEGNEICWTPGKHVTVSKNQVRDVVANKREWHHHIKFSDGHYEPHALDKCPYNGTVCNK